MRPTAIFIDADNTVFNFDQTQKKALAETLNHFELPSHDEALNLYERINLHYWARYHRGEIANEQINELRWGDWLQQLGLVNVPAHKLALHYAESLSRQCEIEPGADQLMEFLFSLAPVHVITNGFLSSQAHRWRLAGWEERLQGMTVSAVVGIQKPEPEIFNIAMKSVGVTDPASCLMIGDSLSADIEGAKAVGMTTCWYRRGVDVLDAEGAADYTVDHLFEILAIFSR